VLCQALPRIRRTLGLDRAPLPANVQASHQFIRRCPKNHVVTITPNPVSLFFVIVDKNQEFRYILSGALVGDGVVKRQ
jgi:hypothetical protein